ncbi:metalloregulator ArsR/SmtB family transcription factor [Marinobacter caseinilyticus]|uniref:metalloregulator ArsR/SmtB family transcription factor n=1 Tax=Marinobacter caseinilyticus TaxID=2692195 RepID=UPI001A944E95|nr:metalloregulator ArsR/SmtB family transcription factor [Marinobacter caseinilyticus]
MPELTPLSPSKLFKALGEPTRLATMLLIDQQSELCVCELTVAVGVSQPKISRHLAQLRAQGLLLDERRGQWIYYRLHPTLPDWSRQLLHITRNANTDFLQPMLVRLETMTTKPPDCRPVIDNTSFNHPRSTL